MHPAKLRADILGVINMIEDWAFHQSPLGQLAILDSNVEPIDLTPYAADVVTVQPTIQ